MAEAASGFGVVPLDPPVRSREIQDVETMRLVADPIRLAILRVLMNDAEFEPPVLSAKELAATLEEPQTKLYRHLKQLEEAGLIQVAETRLVSGIVEQRYRTGQLSLFMSPQLVTDPSSQLESMTLASGVFSDFRDEMLGNVRRGRLRFKPDEPESGGMIFQSMSVRLASERADEFRQRLGDLCREFLRGGDPDGVEAHALIAWYTVDERPEAS